MMLNLEIGRVSIIHTQNISLFYYSMKHILFILEVFPQQHKENEGISKPHRHKQHLIVGENLSQPARYNKVLNNII